MKHPIKHPPCEHCGGPVERRKGEERLRFICRKYCSPQCWRKVLARKTSQRLGSEARA
jgi:formamidopyrimidine-DNA glycosylase